MSALTMDNLVDIAEKSLVKLDHLRGFRQGEEKEPALDAKKSCSCSSSSPPPIIGPMLNFSSSFKGPKDYWLFCNQ